jgi:predicted MFS family arabinose efflux permease
VELVAILVSGGSIVGGYFGGVLVGRWPGWPVLAGPALFQGLALVFLALPNTPAASLLLLTLMGLSYGAIIAVIPGYIRVLYGTSQFARIYGVVFTAWGLAGFSGPLLAGILYDANGDYTAALMAAAALSVIGCIVSVLPSGKWAKPER